MFKHITRHVHLHTLKKSDKGKLKILCHYHTVCFEQNGKLYEKKRVHSTLSYAHTCTCTIADRDKNNENQEIVFQSKH